MSIEKRISNLPTKPEDLHKYILIGRKVLKAQIAKLEAITVAKEGRAAKEAALSDTQDTAEILLYAEAQFGELLEKIPKEQGRRTDALCSPKGTKLDEIEPRRKQRHYAEQLNSHKEVIAEVVAKAREQGEVPVRQKVLREIRLAQPKPEPKPLPKGKYSIIYADPPWEYNDTKGNDPDYAGITYATMKPEEIAKMPISNISAENCILFIWVTMPMLDVCFDVINGWGFEYKTGGFVWVKTKRDRLEADSRGIGHYTKSNAELCLIATKGQFQRERKDIEQIIFAPRERHSQKPNETRKRIVNLCGDIPRIELFARKQADGWMSYGDDPGIQKES